ncbi:MAG: hypothetical protein MI922_05440, partial [Bacteroidales bacterium]|nr:hypothetical protein [Bacteroidales bacterium]
MKNLYILILLLVTSIHLWAQEGLSDEPQNYRDGSFSTTVIRDPLYSSKTLTASDEIIMGKSHSSGGSGFSFKASAYSQFHAYLDATKISTGNFLNKPVSINNHLEEHYENIGTINGEFGVSAMGSATYNIPIEVPKGINGMQPNLTLSYNSNAGEGLAGMGWSLNGVSFISVTSQTLYSDGNIVPVVATEKEAANIGNRLTLDGQRLIRVGDNHLYLKDGAKFMTQNRNYTSITYYKSGTDNYFVIENANGTKMYYGTSTDSKFINANRYVLMWYLKRIEDVHGNYCEYTYKQSRTNKYLMLPEKIVYGGNSNIGNTPVYNVKLLYQQNSLGEIKYLHGAEVNNKVLLEKIQLYKGDILLSNYLLEFFQKEGYTYLNTIKKQVGPGKNNIPKTLFSYSKVHQEANVGIYDFSDTLIERGNVHYSEWKSSQKVERKHIPGVFYVTQIEPYKYLTKATQAQIDAAGGSWEFRKHIANVYDVPRKKFLEHKANNVKLSETVY